MTLQRTMLQYNYKEVRGMALSNAERSKRYRERLKQKAAEGDAHASKMVAKNKNAQLFRNAKSYAKNHATLEEIAILKKILDERKKKLKK